MGDPYLPGIPDSYQKGYLYKVLLSVTNEIHSQIGQLKKQNKKPSEIHLGPVCSKRFAYEQNKKNMDTREAPEKYLDLPVHYNCEKITGVYVKPEDS